MALPPPAGAHTWNSPRVRLFAVPVVGALVLLAGAFDLLARVLAVAIGGGVVAAWATTVLIRTALAIHHETGTFARSEEHTSELQSQ